MGDLAFSIEDTLAWVWANQFALLGWAIALGAFVLVPFRRPPAEARSWLLIFFAMPWLAMLIYWFIGRPYFAKERRARVHDLPQLFDRIAVLAGIDLAGREPQMSADNAALARLAKGLCGFPATQGNCAELLSDYHGTYERIIADIERARHHVHLEFYIFAYDPVGEGIMSALERASRRGVTCRILIDALGSYGWIRKVSRRLRKAGVEVHDILPFRRRWTSSRVDLRNHRKIIVIDGQVGYTGSQNIWDPAAHSARPNQDILLRITGPVIAQLQAIFASDWYLETLEELVDRALFPDPGSQQGHAAQIVATGPDNPEAGVDLIFAQAIYNAADEIVITTPYFIPNGALISAIKAAVLGGVRVRLITSKRSDHHLVGLAQRSYYSELMAAGTEIYLFGPDFLHAKHFRVDREVAILGSSNMDVRSFELNAEIDLVAYDAEFAGRLRELECGYLNHSERLSLDEWKQRPLISKILENSARLMSDLI